MRWPWVSRATYDDANARADRAIAQTGDAIRMTERAYDLIEKFLPSNSASGVQQFPAGKPLAPLPLAERDEVADAIELAAGADKSLARHLSRWAKKQQLDGMGE